MSARVKKKSDRVVGVVGDREGVDADVADFEGGPGGENAAIQRSGGLKAEFDGFAGEAIAVDGNFVFGAKAGDALDMVGMFVGEENAVEGFGRAAESGQAFADLFSREAGVNKDARVSRFEIGAIAAGTAAKNGELH